MVKTRVFLKQNTNTEIVRQDKLYRLLGVRLEGKGPFVREKKLGSQIRAKKLQRVNSEDFIYSRLFAWRGAFGLIPVDMNGAYVSTEFPNFRIDKNKIHPQFLELYFKQTWIWNEVEKHCLGTTKASRNRFKEKFFLDFEVVLPSIDEQKRIAARIERLFVKIEKIRKHRAEVVEKANALFESSVEEIFKNLHSVEKKELSKLTSKIGSGSTPKGGRASYPSSGVPFIRSMNVRMRKFQWGGIAFIYKATHEAMSGTKVKPDDVLLNITGASLGRVACAPPNLVEANVNQHVSIIRPIETLDPRYLMYWLSQPSVQNLINEMQKGATRQALTKAQIELFEVPVPPLREQIHIVAYLNSLQEKVDKLEELQDETEKEIEELIPSILNNAFKGEL